MFLKNTLSSRLVAVLELIRNYHKKEFSNLQLTYSNFITLKLIEENPGLTQVGLAQTNRKDKNVIGRTVDLLEEKNLVERRKDLADRRSYTLFITKNGADFIKKNTKLITNSEMQITKKLSKDELETLYKLLDKILEN